jgi:hypothetical protein
MQADFLLFSSAEDWRAVLEPVIARYREAASPLPA